MTYRNVNRGDTRAPRPMRTAGYYAGLKELVVFGYNADVDAYNAGTPAPEDIVDEGGDYAGQPATAYAAGEIIDFVSDSADDDAAGTGARTLDIVYLDNAGQLATESGIEMDGTTAASTTYACHRILDCRVASAGSGGTSAGNIVGDQTTSDEVFVDLPAGVTNLRAAAATCPSDMFGSLNAAWVNVANVGAPGTAAHAVIALLRRPYLSGVWQEEIRWQAPADAGWLPLQVASGLFLDHGDDIKLRVVDATADNLGVAAMLDLSFF